MGSLTPVKRFYMYTLTQSQKQKALYQLAFFHILIIASSNYLVQLPFVLAGFNTTWGAFTFPFIFLATDLTVRIFGAKLARRIIFIVMLPALMFSYVISVLFFQGSWVGVSTLLEPNLFVARIALASFSAYFVGQLMDITIFNHLRKKPRWWIAPSVSALFGNLVDTLVFFAIAFWHSDNGFMATHWIEIASVDYAFKLFICALFFLPLYGIVLNILQNVLVREQTKKA